MSGAPSPGVAAAPRPPFGRRLLRYAAAACAALALVHAVRAFQQSARDVRLVYTAPPGELTVELVDDEGTRVRRTVFTGAERAHAVRLPDGRYRARMRLGAGEAVHQPFEVRGDGLVEVRFADPVRASAAGRN